MSIKYVYSDIGRGFFMLSLKTFISSILAGFCIGLGGTVFLRLKDAFVGGNVIGAILFTVGLFTVCTRSYSLYTGKACYLFDNSIGKYLLYLLLVWLGNFVGCAICGGLENMTAICGDSGINAVAQALVLAKLKTSYLSLFILGIFCNIFIFIAVNGYAKNPHEVGKYLALFLGVSCFILMGSEHCVADMYYWCVSGVVYSQPTESISALAVITLGNLVGGVSFPVLEKYI